MVDHLTNLMHKHYEKLKKQITQITDINVESEDDQIQYIAVLGRSLNFGIDFLLNFFFD